MSASTRLFNKNFTLLWQGQLVSQLGNMAYSIAMMFWIKHETGSASLVGLIMMVTALPGVLLSPFAGAYADRHSRKKIIVISDIVRGVAVLLLAGSLFAGADTSITIPIIFGVAVLSGIVGAFFSPAISASIPDLVPEDRLPAANSLNQFSVQASVSVGQGIGGVLFRVLGAPMLFLIDALSYIFSGISEMFIDIPQTIPERVRGWRAIVSSFKNDLKEGFEFVWKQKGLKHLFFTAAFLNFFFTPVGVLMPFYVEDHLMLTPDWYGYFMAAMGAGSMVGFLMAGAIRTTGSRRATLMVVALIILSSDLLIIGSVLSAWIVITVLFISGMAAGFFNIGIMTILQLTTPREKRGRIFGLLGTIASGLTPISMGLAGVVADLVNQNIPLLFIIVGSVAVGLSLLVSSSRAFREYIAYESNSNKEGKTI